MAWKKIVVSGSTAQLSTLNVDSSIEASTLSGSFSGSYVGNGSGLTDLTVSQTATAVSNFTSQTSVTTTHNFDTKNVTVQAYNSDDELIIPKSVTTTNANQVTTTFDTATTGRVVVAKGGHIVSGSIEFSNILNKPAGIVSSSQGIVNLAANIVSSSAQTIANVAAGGANIVSSSQGIVNLGANIVSSSGQVVALVEAGSDSNTFTDADHTKLNGIEASADVTDTANVTAAGAVMDSELTNEAAVKAINQGLATGNDVTFATVTTTGDVTIAGDLNVTGDTIQAQVTNLNVEDKFILLNSGSNSGDAGIVFGGAGGSTANTGDGIFYDDSDSVFAYAENIASNATTATNASKLGNIEVASSNPSSAPTFQGIGTIHINDSDEGIWIYS